jgi:MoxR-like ATPase
VASLREAAYIADTSVATAVYLADRLGKPLLIEGPAGVGKTELAKAVATSTGLELVRLQCYEGLDEAKALYEWNYRKQLLRIQADEAREHHWEEIEESIFDEPFLLERPLLHAIRAPEPVVLLVDEIDRTEFEFEAFLLELLSEFQVTVPELGTITARHLPMVFLTSNATRELSEALKRRALYLFLDYPEAEREREIILTRVPELPEALAEQMVRLIRAIRDIELKKKPSISESIDWARTLVELGIESLDENTTKDTLNVVLKYRQDLERVAQQLKLPPSPHHN